MDAFDPTIPSYEADFYSDDFICDPLPHYARMRELGPVVWLPRHRNFAITRYSEVREVLRRWDIFSSAEGISADDVGCAFARGTTITADPPRHGEMRRILNEPLLPGALRGIQGLIQETASELIENLAQRRTFDGIADLARILPLTIVTDLVGLPDEGRENMLHWAAAAFDILGTQNERGRQGFEVIKEMRKWIAEHASRDRLKPNSWTARLHTLVADGKMPAEYFGPLMRDYIAPSPDTTISATGHLVYLLGSNPDQFQLLKRDPSLVPNAVNEAVRLGSPIRSFSRTVRTDTEFSNHTLPANARVMVLYGSANRDERKFADPNMFDVTRSNADHVGFGHGTHMCAGMHLARLEIESLLTAMLDRFATISVGAPVIALNNTINGFASLPVIVEPSQQTRKSAGSSQPNISRWIETTVKRVVRHGPRILSFELASLPNEVFPVFAPGAHVDVEVAAGVVRQYSLCNDPRSGGYRIAVLLDPNSRGGSSAIHESFREGVSLRISAPRNLFALNEHADHSILFAAGIGITPIVSMVHRLHALGRRFTLHYSVRSRKDAAFWEDLRALEGGGAMHLHVSEEGTRLDMERALRDAERAAHVYICGPERYVSLLASTAKHLEWPETRVHVERFGAIEEAGPRRKFTVIAARSGQSYLVPVDKTILDVLIEAGFDMPFSCQSGVCGTCLVGLVEGEAEHNDVVQTDLEKASNSRIAVCCSRARGDRLVLDV